MRMSSPRTSRILFAQLVELILGPTTQMIRVHVGVLTLLVSQAMKKIHCSERSKECIIYCKKSI